MRLNCSAHRLVDLLGNRRMKIHSDCTEMHAQIISWIYRDSQYFNLSIAGFLPVF